MKIINKINGCCRYQEDGRSVGGTGLLAQEHLDGEEGLVAAVLGALALLLARASVAVGIGSHMHAGHQRTTEGERGTGQHPQKANINQLII